MPIESSGEIRLRGAAGDGRTDINEEINSNATDTDVSLGTLNTTAFTDVTDGNTTTGRSMSEMRGFALVTADPFYPTTEATGSLGDSLYVPATDTISYLNRNTDLDLTGTTGTYSFWLKRNDITNANQSIYSSGSDQLNRVWLRFNTSGSVVDSKFQVVTTTGGTTHTQLVYDYPFTDTSAWYHIIVAFDTTKSYQYDRVRVYANGTELTEIDGSVKTETWPSQNQLLYFNHKQRLPDPQWATGYSANTTFADAKFIDGQQLRPDSFGEMKNGIWVPKAFNTPSTDTIVTSNRYIDIRPRNQSDISGSTITNNGTLSNGTLESGIDLLQNNSGILDVASTEKISGSSWNLWSSSTDNTDSTVEAWINIDTALSSGFYTLVGANGGSSGEGPYRLIIRGYGSNQYYIDQFRMISPGYYDKSTKTPTVTLRQNTWYHIACTYTATTRVMKTYLNGVLVESFTASFTSSYNLASNDFAINQYRDSAQQYGLDGKYGDIRVYSAALTDAEVLQNYNATKHYYAYGLNGFHLPLNNTNTGTIVDDTSLKLHLDASNSSSYGGSGTTWSDLTTNNNDGTISGAGFLSSTNGGVFDFDGTNDRIYTNSTFMNIQEFTVGGWFKFGNKTSSQVLIAAYEKSSQTTGDAGWMFRWHSTLGLNFGHLIGSTWGNSSVAWTPTQGEWYHLAMSRNSSGSEIKFYVNGIQEGATQSRTGTLAYTFNGGTATFTIGGVLYNSSPDQMFKGNIAQVRTYNKVLSAQEIIQNYRATQGNYEQISTVDISGNANNFTATNLDYTDHIKDQPAENYATLNPLAENTGASYSEGNLKVTSQQDTITATLSVNSGKWYAEATCGSINNAYIGIFGADYVNPGMAGGWSSNGAIAYKQNGDLYSLTKGSSSSVTSYGSSYTSGDIIGIELDVDSNTIEFYKNGVSQGVTVNGPSYIGASQYTFAFYAGTASTNGTVTYNFGQNPWVYGPSTGFKAVATHNLPNAQFDPKDSEQNKDYFKAVIYQGNGGTQGEAYGIVDGSKAAVFNGSSSKITTTVNSDDVEGISMWFYFVSGDTFHRTIGCNISSGNPQTYFEVGTNGSVGFAVKNTARSAGAGTLGNTGWKHAYIDSSGNFYLNGSSVSTSSVSFTGTTNVDLIIGSLKSNYGFFNSNIDQVRFFNKTLSASEVSDLYDEQDLTATTRSTTDIFSDGSGVALYELNGDALDTGGVSGKFNDGAIFNGSSSYIDLGQRLLGGTHSASAWVKTSTTGVRQVIIGNAYDGSTYGLALFIETDNKLYLQWSHSNSWINVVDSTANRVNDGDWHHVAYFISAGSQKLYVDGTEVASGTTSSTAQNNTTAPTIIGRNWNASGYFKGTIDQVRIFNKALSTNNNGVNEINELYTESGANLSTTDILGDGSGVALYQLDGDATDSSGTITGTTVTLSGGSSSYAYANASASSGKYYWEVKVITNGYSSGSTLMAGVANTSTPSGGWQSGNNYFYYASNGYKYSNGSSSAYGGTWQQGYVIGVALDLDNDTLTFYRNNTSQGQAYSGLNGSYYPSFATGLYADEAQFIFDSNDWTYSAPSGYSEWTAAKTASIVTGNGATTSQITYDGTETNILYAYNGTASNVTYTQDKPYGNIDLGFAPDLVWIKSRSHATSHELNDSVRGQVSRLYSDSTSAAGTIANGFVSLDSNGFSLDGAGGGGEVNTSGRDYVAWCWKAAGFKNDFNVIENGTLTTSNSNTTAGITAGSNTTNWVVSANRDTGFSIVKYTGTGSNTNFGHGLSASPELTIIKNIDDGTRDWIVHPGLEGSNKYLVLNQTNLINTSSLRIQSVNSTIVNVGSNTEVNANNQDFICYNFHSIDGFSKIGSYIGNSSSDGPFIYTGFKPAWIMIKKISGTAYSNSDRWLIWDNTREEYNRSGDNQSNVLYADDAAAENGIKRYTTQFYSNGFKLAQYSEGHNNTSSEKYLYMAFAEDPSTTSNSVATLGDGNEFIEDGNYPEDNFSTTLYTGDGTTGRNFNTLNFKPDFIWWKQRNGTTANILTDTVRGIDKSLISNTTGAEFSQTYYTSFNNNGWTFNNSALNASNETAAVWTWKAAGNENTYNILENGVVTSSASASTLGLNIGSVTPDAISANRDNGFSIIAYTGPNQAATIDHGLSKPPEIYIIKNRTNIDNWRVYHKALGGGYYLNLDSNSAATAASTVFNNSNPTSKIFNIGTAGSVSENNSNFIVYAWHSVLGFSKIDSYSGNGGSQSIYTGFEPAWVLIKDEGADSWRIQDNKRGPGYRLYADSNTSEGYTNTSITSFNSDGFTVGSSYGVNEPGQTYIYMAFAHR